MRRRTPTADRVPVDLRTYDAGRWVLALHDSIFTAHVPAGQRSTHWAVIHLRAPMAYREALVEALGDRRGNAHFDTVKTTTSPGTDAACPCEFCTSKSSKAPRGLVIPGEVPPARPTLSAETGAAPAGGAPSLRGFSPP